MRAKSRTGMSDFITMFDYLYVNQNLINAPTIQWWGKPQSTASALTRIISRLRGQSSRHHGKYEGKRGTYRISAPPLPEPSTTLLILKQLDWPQTAPWSEHSKQNGHTQGSQPMLRKQSGRSSRTRMLKPWSRSGSWSCPRGKGAAGGGAPRPPLPAPPETPFGCPPPHGAPPTRMGRRPPPPLEAARGAWAAGGREPGGGAAAARASWRNSGPCRGPRSVHPRFATCSVILAARVEVADHSVSQSDRLSWNEEEGIRDDRDMGINN
jgi:hypothetical protein